MVEDGGPGGPWWGIWSLEAPSKGLGTAHGNGRIQACPQRSHFLKMARTSGSPQLLLSIKADEGRKGRAHSKLGSGLLG